METTTYYSIKFLSNSLYYNRGDVLKTAEPIITIGESADCDIRIDKPENYADELYYATIRKVEDANEWVLIKRNPLVDVRIVGKEAFEYMTTLQDNDIIEFGEQSQSLRFVIHHDSSFNQAGVTIVQKSNNHIIYSMLAFIAIVIVGISTYFYSTRPRDIRPEEVGDMEAAILRIDVDSVAFVEIVKGKETSLTVKHCEEEGKSSGTAFITEDDELITARHCIEYWLGMAMSPMQDIDALAETNILKWAAEVETYNYTHENGDTIMALRSYCSLYDNQGKYLTTFSSSTADNTYIDRSHDAILTLDNIDNCYYWRTITPYFVNREMLLGDIFCMPNPVEGIKSCIRLADTEFIHSLKKMTPLAFYGYPENEEHSRKLRFAEGKVSTDYADNKHVNEHDIVHSGEINPGFSGGPVIARNRLGFVIVGVISKVDSVDNNSKLAVPVIVRKKGGKK